ncbi:hypothetical protein ACQP2T_30640 [Nonomuraea sp. CA-143628]|uniref:hypothetical protein n=1 Tax=Nonomuraea sp. CA-143628 TaxID=3239997 RepID=UPI003D8FEE22
MGVPKRAEPGHVLIADRAPVEHGFAHLKTWRILTKRRPRHLLRALPVLTNLELDRWQTIKTEDSRPRPAQAPTNPATPAAAPAKTKMVDLQ